jgi:hypothetical protein
MGTPRVEAESRLNDELPSSIELCGRALSIERFACAMRKKHASVEITAKPPVATFRAFRD